MHHTGAAEGQTRVVIRQIQGAIQTVEIQKMVQTVAVETPEGEGTVTDNNLSQQAVKFNNSLLF